MTTPTTIQVLNGTRIQREGEYLLIKELGGMKSLVAFGTARIIKFFIMHPATSADDKCKMEQVYQAKRGVFCGRHIEFAIEYANDKMAPIQDNPTQPKSVKTTKISSYKGRTLYRAGPYNVSVTRKTISERVGCGLRKSTSVCDWHAIDRADPVGGKSFSGYGGIRDAVAKLEKLATV